MNGSERTKRCAGCGVPMTFDEHMPWCRRYSVADRARDRYIAGEIDVHQLEATMAWVVAREDNQP